MVGARCRKLNNTIRCRGTENRYYVAAESSVTLPQNKSYTVATNTAHIAQGTGTIKSFMVQW